MTVTITGEVLRDMSAYEIHSELVETSLRRGHDFEIVQVHKTSKDKLAYHCRIPRAEAKTPIPPGFGTPRATYLEHHLVADMDKKGDCQEELPHPNYQEYQCRILTKQGHGSAQENDGREQCCMYILSPRQRSKGST
jgi:hypothetical protein